MQAIVQIAPCRFVQQRKLLGRFEIFPCCFCVCMGMFLGILAALRGVLLFFDLLISRRQPSGHILL